VAHASRNISLKCRDSTGDNYGGLGSSEEFEIGAKIRAANSPYQTKNLRNYNSNPY
jgi:hypothetical protein